MKKLLATILALVMALSLCSVSWAAGLTTETDGVYHIKSIMKIFKKMDLVIIVVLIIFSFIPHCIYSNVVSKNNKNLYATIKVNGKVHTTIDLPVGSEKRLPISTDHGNNTIVINGNEIKIVDADCKDELCIKQGSISKIGKTLICLPNELIIEIKGDEYDSSDDLILSH